MAWRHPTGGQARATEHTHKIFSPYKLMPFKNSFSVVRILKLKRQEINVLAREWWNKTKTPHWFKSVCSDGKGWQLGSTLFLFYLVTAEVCWVPFYFREKLSD